jgi:hypothetical protein
MTRHLLGSALMLVALAGCTPNQPVDPGPPQLLLSAYTRLLSDPAASDTIACQLSAFVPLADGKIVPWQGVVQARAWRGRFSGGRLVAESSIAESSLLTITTGPGDSLHVKLEGKVNVALDGRFDSHDGATGDWTCGGAFALTGSAPGEARGAWSLERGRLVD